MSEETCGFEKSRFHDAAASVVLIIAGVFGHRYVAEPGAYSSLVFYVLCLGLSVFLIVRNIREVDLSHVIPADQLREAPKLRDPSLREDIGLKAKVQTSSKPRPVVSSGPIQSSLDFDGTDALKALEQVTGQWLVTDASDPAAHIIRLACLEHVQGGDAEIARVERWFDIADSLRSRTCRELPKAEVRRSFVADHHGVSKEQVSQIDQGRYLPLNKLLDGIDPKTLKIV